MTQSYKNFRKSVSNLSEGISDNKLIMLKKFSKEASQLTDSNHHIGALLAAAEYLTKKNTSYNKLYDAIKSLETLNSYFGHSPESVISLEKDFRKILAKAMTPEEQKAFQDIL